jgi:membrane protease YdiL (CAAX protease family)
MEANTMSDSERKKTIRSILIFSFLVLTLAFMGPLLGGSPSAPGLGFILWGTAPLLVALVMRLVTRDWSDVGVKPAIRKNLPWYMLSILAWPVMIVLTLLSGALISASSVSGFSMIPYLKTVLPGFVFFFIFAIFEEFGWRGYLVPKLASIGMNGYLAYAIVGIVWATWHLPYIRELLWVYNAEDLTTFIPRFYLSTFAFSILFNELRLITGSVWPAVLIQSLANAVGHPLIAAYVTIAPGQQYLGAFDGLFMIAFASILGIALNRWRMRQAIHAGLSKSFA